MGQREMDVGQPELLGWIFDRPMSAGSPQNNIESTLCQVKATGGNK